MNHVFLEYADRAARLQYNKNDGNPLNRGHLSSLFPGHNQRQTNKSHRCWGGVPAPARGVGVAPGSPRTAGRGLRPAGAGRHVRPSADRHREVGDITLTLVDGHQQRLQRHTAAVALNRQKATIVNISAQYYKCHQTNAAFI